MTGLILSLNRDTASLIVDSAVDAIRRDPATFRDVLDEIPAALYVTDVEGTITYFNKACTELAGRTPGQLGAGLVEVGDRPLDVGDVEGGRNFVEHIAERRRVAADRIDGAVDDQARRISVERKNQTRH